MSETPSRSIWPQLPWRDWEPTLSRLHMWLQIVGKVPLALSAPLNHWWHIGLHVTPRGLATAPIPYRGRVFQVEINLLEHQLTVADESPNPFTMPLEPHSVASFYRGFTAGLRSRGIDVRIWPHPVEVAEAIPFEEDEGHGSYNPRHAEALSHALTQVHRVMATFGSGFIGKQSAPLLYWGSFDLATARFSGRAAPEHPGGVPHCADWVMVEAESAEQSVAGFWPAGATGPMFFAYAYPEPRGYRDALVAPGGARFDHDLGEFILPYEAVSEAPEPDEALLSFFESTYGAAADLGLWDRGALEPRERPNTPPRKPWSLRE